MKQILVLLALGFMLIALSCNSQVATDDGISSWNDVNANWTDAKTYDANSAEAQKAIAFYNASKYDLTVYTIAHFNIILESVVDNGDGTQTWTYSITKVGSGPTMQDLSHFDMLFDTCTEPNFVDFGGAEYQVDPTSPSCTGGEAGLKWDWGVSGSDTSYYSFTTDQVYEIGIATGIVKYATHCATGSLPGPDCSAVVEPPDPGSSSSGGGSTSSGGGEEGPCDWIDRLDLDASITYFNNHGYNHLGFPLYYIGDTMESDTVICNATGDDATNLKITILEELYGSGVLCPGASVKVFTGVTILAHACGTFHKSYYLSAAGNFQTHVIVEREGDADCPDAAVIFDSPGVGFWDP
jgi:sorbitol-specific phosphotransferase system component IIA